MTQLTAPSGLFDLRDKSALISGASGALGEAAARALAGAGAHVTLAGGNVPKLDALADEIAGAEKSVSTVEGRPADEAAAEKLVAAAAESRGLDIVVAASGFSIVKPILEMTPDEFGSVMDANVRQTWLLSRAAAKRFVEQGRGGKMILISSVRGQFAAPGGTSAYGTSKAAINLLTRSLAVELGPHGVCVNAIAPTVFRSELTAWLFEDKNEKARAKVLQRIPLGRLGEPDDFTGIFMFLASRASDFLTGEIINLDGGFSAN